MPDPAGTKTDGSIKFGSQVLTIQDSAGVDQQYIADDFSLDGKSNWLVSKNQNGVPNKQVGMRDVRTGTATLQFPTDATKAPKQFAEFDGIDATGVAVKLIVADVGEKYGSEAESKINIAIREKLNVA